ncbi:SDR family oxidoreductase [Streptomyces rectiviolaceus]|uniref:NAD(P)H-binding protein n=1 Tax=Streptomyces rectiviolaceus TaxID=332591 RepID=A0ABP6M8V7_9ACTN
MFTVIGATGHVGREAVRLLLERGQEVAAVSRSDRPSAVLPDGAHAVCGDPSRPASLASALPDRIEALLLGPRPVGTAGAELLSLAAERGAKRVVALSALTVEQPVGHPRFIEEFRAFEDVVRASGLPWTVLRCADFAANSLAWAPQIRASGAVHGAYAAAATSPVHPRDIAEVAVRALTGPGHTGQALALTGPRSLDQRDKVRIIGETIDRELAFHEVDPEQVRRTMLAQGLPADVSERLLGSLADYAKTPGRTYDTVERILGRPALGYALWASENAAAFTGTGGQ